MKYKLQDEYIELFKLLKILDLVDSGAQAKMLIENGYVTRNGEVERRKRAKIRSNEVIDIADVTIRVVQFIGSGSPILTPLLTVYTMRRTAVATKVYKKFGIVHAKKFLNHTEIDTTMKYLNIDDDMEVVDYGL